MGVRTRSAAVRGSSGNLAAATAEVTRLRLGLEGLPAVPSGRRFGADAERRHRDAPRRRRRRDRFRRGYRRRRRLERPEARALSAALRGRGLLTHEAKGFRQRGLAGSFSWDPVTGDRGLRLSLTQTLGVPAQGVVEAPLGRTALAGRSPNDPGNAPWQRRLEARFGYGFAAFGYGFAAFGDRFTSTPEIAVGVSDAGRDYSLGWRLVRGRDTPDGSAMELTVEVRRRESASGRNDPPGHAVGVRMISRF